MEELQIEIEFVSSSELLIVMLILILLSTTYDILCTVHQREYKTECARMLKFVDDRSDFKKLLIVFRWEDPDIFGLLVLYEWQEII